MGCALIAIILGADFMVVVIAALILHLAASMSWEDAAQTAALIGLVIAWLGIGGKRDNDS